MDGNDNSRRATRHRNRDNGNATRNGHPNSKASVGNNTTDNAGPDNTGTDNTGTGNAATDNAAADTGSQGVSDATSYPDQLPHEAITHRNLNELLSKNNNTNHESKQSVADKLKSPWRKDMNNQDPPPHLLMNQGNSTVNYGPQRSGYMPSGSTTYHQTTAAYPPAVPYHSMGSIPKIPYMSNSSAMQQVGPSGWPANFPNPLRACPFGTQNNGPYYGSGFPQQASVQNAGSQQHCGSQSTPSFRGNATPFGYGTNTNSSGSFQSSNAPGLMVYNQTVPRDFRPPSLIHNVAPPAWNLPTGNRPRTNTQNSTSGFSDPFVSPQTDRRAVGFPLHRGSVSSVGSQGSNLDLVLRSSGPLANVTSLMPSRGFLQGRPDRSTLLATLTAGPTGVPTAEAALHSNYFPFIESCSQAGPTANGLVKLENIPFDTDRALIIALLGRNAKILNDIDEPVHIIMERQTSKTQDAYVEFISFDAALRCVERLKEQGRKGRKPRLDGREVQIRTADQAELMNDLFPHSKKSVDWHGAQPQIRLPVAGEPWTQFKGFVSEDEMATLAKHAEVPGRGQFSKEYPQRPYECMISTLKKFPWYMSSHITVRTRHAIYDATVRMMDALERSLANPKKCHKMLTPQLYNRLVRAAMMCPGFSVVQKDNIATSAKWDDDKTRRFNQPFNAYEWKHLHALCPRPGRPVDVLDWYIAFIREETIHRVNKLAITKRAELENIARHTSGFFGYFWAELGLPEGDEFDNMTLHELAERELETIQSILLRVLPSNSPLALPELEEE